jgi:hypothetical protein
LQLLHGVLADGASASAERDLERMLDQVTPYYKARFEDLPTQAQQIVDAVALHWHPMTASECADKTAARRDAWCPRSSHAWRARA